MNADGMPLVKLRLLLVCKSSGNETPPTAGITEMPENEALLLESDVKEFSRLSRDGFPTTCPVTTEGSGTELVWGKGREPVCPPVTVWNELPLINK